MTDDPLTHWLTERPLGCLTASGLARPLPLCQSFVATHVVNKQTAYSQTSLCREEWQVAHAVPQSFKNRSVVWRERGGEGLGKGVGTRVVAERVAALLKFVLSHGCLTPGGAHMGFPECIDAVLNVSELATTAVTRNRSAC